MICIVLILMIEMEVFCVGVCGWMVFVVFMLLVLLVLVDNMVLSFVFLEIFIVFVLIGVE